MEEKAVPVAGNARAVAIESSEGVFRLKILDAQSHRGVSDALVVENLGIVRAASASSLRTLARADEMGIAILEAEDIRSGQQKFVVAEGYSTELVHQSLFEGSDATVWLDGGHGLDVECVDIHGKPVGKCGVFLSAGELPSRAEQREMIAREASLGIGPHAVYLRIADETGLAQFRGVPPGRYRYTAYSDGHLAVQNADVNVPASAAEKMVMAPIRACVVSVEGDEMLAYNFFRSLGGRKGGHNMRIACELNDVQKLLESRFRGSLVNVCLEMLAGDCDTHLVVRALLRTQGVARLTAPYLPIREIDGPFIVQPSHYDRSVPCHDVLIVVQEEGAIPVGDAKVYVDTADGFMVPISNGNNVLPEGEHGLVCLDERFELVSRGSVVIPGSFTVELRRVRYPVRFDVVDSLGVEYRRFQLSLATSSGKSSHIVYGNDNTVFFLDSGAIEAAAIVWGVGMGSESVSIVPDREIQGVLIVVRENIVSSKEGKE